MSDAQTEVPDLVFISCWLNEQELVRSAVTEVVGTCDTGYSQQGLGSLARARGQAAASLTDVVPSGRNCLPVPTVFVQ